MNESLLLEISSLANKISKMNTDSSVSEYYDLTLELFEKIIILKNSNTLIKKLELKSQQNNNPDSTTEGFLVNNKEKIETTSAISEKNLTLRIFDKQSSNISFEKKKNHMSSKLNDKFAKIFKVDVNERSAFIQKLFDKKTDEYEDTMKKVSSIEDWPSIYQFIQNEIKPNYKSWNDNLTTEKRFLDLLKKQSN